MSDLRPTLFLAQLSNLLAGNISIVHGVTGSSRTFMGEEAAGVDAVRIALARIAAGQSDIALVGGAYNAERQDMLLLYEFGGMPRGRFAPVWERGDAAAAWRSASLGAFLVLEARAMRRRAAPSRSRGLRGCHPIASSAQPGAVTAALDRCSADRAEARCRTCGRDLRRDRRASPRPPRSAHSWQACRTFRCAPRHPSRPWPRAAIPDEHRACRDRVAARKLFRAGDMPASKRDGRPARAGRRDRRRPLARRRPGAGRSGR